jgi:hypothetical protein
MGQVASKLPPIPVSCSSAAAKSEPAANRRSAYSKADAVRSSFHSFIVFLLLLVSSHDDIDARECALMCGRENARIYSYPAAVMASSFPALSH